VKLAINRCPSHGYWSVSLDSEGHGLRLTPGKCCGRWDTVKAWNVDPQKLIEDIEGELGCDDCAEPPSSQDPE
jgi:hypothetical protein